MLQFVKGIAVKAATASFIIGDTVCKLSIDSISNLTSNEDKLAIEKELRIKSMLIQANYMGMHKDLSKPQQESYSEMYQATCEANDTTLININPQTI